MAKRHAMIPILTSKDIERFWAKVDKDHCSCWIWTSALCQPWGYGRFSIRNVGFGANRIAYFLATGIDPDNLFVLHKCDNPQCVNPSHLFLGTQYDNINDMDAKGRRKSNCAKGDDHHSRKHPEIVPRGINHPRAKLNDDAVRQIRSKAISGQTQRSIASEFGVSQFCIQMVVNHKRWKHVV